jgi:hypothetical protein
MPIECSRRKARRLSRAKAVRSCRRSWDVRGGHNARELQHLRFFQQQRVRLDAGITLLQPREHRLREHRLPISESRYQTLRGGIAAGRRAATARSATERADQDAGVAVDGALRPIFIRLVPEAGTAREVAAGCGSAQ